MMHSIWQYQQSTEVILPSETEGDWIPLDNQPLLRDRLRSPLIEGVYVGEPIALGPEVVTLDKWWRDFEKPPIATKPGLEGLFVLGLPQSVVADIVALDAWLPRPNQPPDARRPHVWHQALFIDADLPFGPEIVTVDKWYKDLEDLPARAALRATDFWLGTYVGEPIAPPPPPPPEPPFVGVWTEEETEPDGWVEEEPV